MRELIIAALIAVIVFQHACHDGLMRVNRTEPETKTVTSVKIVRDTVTREINVPVPVPSLIRDTILIGPRTWSGDTVHVYNTFFNQYRYEQQLKDSFLIATITDTISQNRIQSRSFKYQILKPTEITTNTTTITPPAEQKTKLFVGFNIGGTKHELTSITPAITLITPRDKYFSVGYNLSANAVELGIKWKISLRK